MPRKPQASPSDGASERLLDMILRVPEEEIIKLSMSCGLTPQESRALVEAYRELQK